VLFEHLRRFGPTIRRLNTSDVPANNSGTGGSQIRSGLDDFRRRRKRVAPLWRAHGNREALVID
jgi:hypothetical protein